MEMIPLSVPDLSDAEEKAVADCVKSGWVSTAGPDIAGFEEDIAALCQRKYGIATSTGTAALQLMLSSLDIGVGDKVILPSFCFAATANAIIHTGAEPVFVDATRLNWVMDVELVSQALAADSSIKAILAVDVLNNFPDYQDLQRLADQYDCFVLEDAAGALMASNGNDVNIGGMGGSFGTASVVSFNGNKVITTGGGGMVVTDDEALAKKLKHLAAQARGSVDYSHDAVGFNFRMPNLNAAMGRAQVKRLPDMIARRKEILEAYQDAAAKMPECRMQPQSDREGSNGWLSSLLFDKSEDAKAFILHMKGLEIMTRGFWKPLHDQPPYASYCAYLTGVAEDISPRIVTLPSSSCMTDAELDRVLHGMDLWET